MRMTGKSRKFKQAILKGNTIKDSMQLAGYSTNHDNKYGYALMHKLGLREALNKQGLDDDSIAKTISYNIQTGSGIKATSDSARGWMELALKLRGDLSNTDAGDTTNIYIKELHSLPDDELLAKLKAIEADIQE